MSKASDPGVRRHPTGIKSDDGETGEQEATQHKNAAEEVGGTSASAEQDSADDYKHRENHKSAEQDSEKPRGDYDSACGWKEVYAEQGCAPGSWRP